MMINFPSILLWGFAATALLTTLTVTGQSLGLTRIDIPFILGTMFTADRDRAKPIGIAVHIANGWLLAIVYAVLFQQTVATWWCGTIAGCLQGLFVVVVLLPAFPGIHPRMVSDARGPEPTRLLEPPGFLATNYGRNTPWIIVCANAAYGALLGAFYVPR